MATVPKVEDIDLRNLVSRLWRGRAFMILIPLLTVALAVVAISIMVFRSERPMTYFVALKSIENARYPNGADFAPRDLVSPAVLGGLRQQLQIDPTVDLANNIQVAFSSPLAEGIAKKHRERLSSRNLSQAEISTINNEFLAELNKVNSTGLRIDVNFAAMGLEPATGAAIARKLPQVWSQVFTTQFRTLTSTEMAAIVPDTAVESFRDAAGILRVNSYLADMLRGLDLIREDNRLSNVQEKSGLTAQDIVDQMLVYRDIYYNPVFATSLKGADNLVAGVYLRNEQLKIDDWERQVAGIDEILRTIQQHQAASVARSDTMGAQPQSPAIQFDEGALTQIIELTEKASLSEYLTSTLKERQELVEQISDSQRIIDLANSNVGEATVASSFAQEAFQGFQEIVTAYNGVLQAARERAEDRSGDLYVELLAPAVDGQFIPPRSLALIFGALLLGLVIATVVAVLRVGR